MKRTKKRKHVEGCLCLDCRIKSAEADPASFQKPPSRLIMDEEDASNRKLEALRARIRSIAAEWKSDAKRLRQALAVTASEKGRMRLECRALANNLHATKLMEALK